MTHTKGLLAIATLFALTAPASADPDEPGAYSYAWSDPRLRSGVGFGVQLGGGISGFTDGNMRDVTANVAGAWDMRTTIGTHVPIGVDIGYLGTAASLHTFAGDANGTLIGTTIEAVVRWNILPHAIWNPYVFAGSGWQRYDVANMQFAVSDTGIRDSDDLIEFPIGTGVSYRRSGFVGDFRATFRATSESTLLTQQDGSHVPLHTWNVAAALGYEF
jgi:hypothetical protein